jgi:hypothetical protein
MLMKVISGRGLGVMPEWTFFGSLMGKTRHENVI